MIYELPTFGYSSVNALCKRLPFPYRIHW